MTPHPHVLRLTLVLATLAVADVEAQEPSASSGTRESATASWVHESWTVKDGLPVNSVNGLIQDRQGYIWAATFDGLVRFDGIRFTVFNSAKSEELPSNRIVQIKEAPDASLWLGTAQGHVVRFRDGRFTNIRFVDGAPDDRFSNLFVDSAGKVWLGTRRGLWRVENDRLVQIGRPALSGPVRFIMQRRDGSIWIGTDRLGVFRVTGDNSVEKVAIDPAVDADSIMTMYEDRAGNLLIGGSRALWSWRDRGVEVKESGRSIAVTNIVEVPATKSVFVESSSGIFRIHSNQAIRAREKNSAFGVGRLGLWADQQSVWNINGQDVFRDGRLVFTIPEEHHTVRTTLFDREGSLWLGTQAGGLHLFKQAPFRTYGIPEGLNNANVYPTYVDRSGAVWLATLDTWGISRIDPTSGEITSFGEHQLPFVNSFYQEESGRMWVGAGPGLFACAPPTMTCHVEGPADLHSRAVHALYADAGGRLWVGAAGRLFRNDGTTWTSFGPESGAPDATVLAFATTRDGALWMGTNGAGLARYRDGRFSRLTHDGGLPSDLIRSLYADADGWLWVGTEGRGLARVDPRAWNEPRAIPKTTIVRIGTANGLFDEVIHQILEDDAGRLWMNTNRGIFWVPRADLIAFAGGRLTSVHSTAYSERDGMRNREGNGGVQPAGAKGPDGRLWFPTQNGVVVVDPAKITADRRAPPIVVEQVNANGRMLRPERGSVRLGPEQRDIQIEYTALTFLQPANVRFRYRLERYDAGWVDAGNRRTAFYTKVPPGQYAFRVEVSDAVGGWHEPGAALAIRVMPHVWETSVFRWVVGATLGILLALAVRVRDARLRARSVQLEQVVDERTAALREREHELAQRNTELQSLDHAKTRFFANVSHELRTPLTLTIGPLEDLRTRAGGDPQVERWLDIALRNSRRLLRLVNQILDVAKLEAGSMHLAPRPMDLAPFTRGVVSAFAPVAEQKGIRLTTEIPDALVGAFDADAVEKILTNLLSNALKFTPSGGTVAVELSRDGDSVHLHVRDSGPGIPADHLAHVFERFYRVDESTSRTQPGTGIGLSLVKELVELHGGRIAVSSSGGGTTFMATIPIVAVPAGVVIPDAADIAGAAVGTIVTAEHGSGSTEPLGGDRGEDVPTLLVVDDSADLRGYIRDHFAVRFRVLEAGDGGEGIELAQRHLPDVVLSDVMMPGTDGHELVRVLRESPETNFLSIILLTAQAEDEQRLEGLERGADDYIVKPFEMRELDVRVRNLIASRRRLRERFSSPRVTAAQPASPTIVPEDRAYATRVRDLIRQRLDNPDFGVAELADGVAQDRSHLFRRVKEVFGEPPSELIRRLRLEEGARLLEADSGSVTDVAYAVGFNSLSYFCRCFQDVYGVTPAAYRARLAVER